jgi:hypothetical protein
VGWSGKLFISLYSSYTSPVGPGLWVSDGTEAGTERISAVGFRRAGCVRSIDAGRFRRPVDLRRPGS